MHYYVLTLFPEMITNACGESILGRASQKGLISVEAINIRDYSTNKHNRVDDYPYGGGAGMVMQPMPVYDAWKDLTERIGKKPRVLFMTPQGKPFSQKLAEEYAKEEDLIFLCGHYEGIDQRVLDLIVTDEVSAGDFVPQAAGYSLLHCRFRCRSPSQTKCALPRSARSCPATRTPPGGCAMRRWA